MRSSRLFPALACCFVLTSDSWAAEVCTEAELRSAIASGGTITFGCDQTIILSTPLRVATNVELDASGRNVTLSGGGTSRIFEVAAGVSFSARNLRVINGFNKGVPATYTPPSGFPGDQGTKVPGGNGLGGALAATNATIHFASCVFSNNVVEGGDPIFPGSFGAPPPYVPGGAALGGAIHLQGGELTLTNSVFVTNSARAVFKNLASPGIDPVPWTDANGGALSLLTATSTILRCDFYGNAAINGGGAVYLNSTEVTFENSKFSTNAVAARTADRFDQNPESSGHGGAVEARESSLLQVNNCFFTQNSISGGGGYFGSTGTLAGGAIFCEGDVQVTSSQFVGNSIQGHGQSAPPVISRGGAICVEGAMDAIGSRFAGNSVVGGTARVNSAGGINPPANAYGGGLYVVGPLRLNNSSIVSNNAISGLLLSFGDPVGSGRAEGSGIYSSNSVFSTNVTVAYNECRNASPDAAGGAVFLTGGHNDSVIGSQFEFCTFATNQSGAPGSSTLRTIQLVSDTNAVATIRGSIFSGGSSNSVLGDFLDAGHNISSETIFTDPTSKNATDPKIGPLGFYGGTTETIPVLAGSPAINAITSGAFPPTDQRGRMRPFGSAADIGAYEVSAPYIAHGRIRNRRALGAVTLAASGAPVEQFEGTGEFVGFFETSGVLKPLAEGIVFYPAEIPLTAGMELFDAEFTGYFVKQVAIEFGLHSNLNLTFAAETAGEYLLFVSNDLVNWTESGDAQTVPANGLFRTEMAPGAGPQFFRVGRK